MAKLPIPLFLFHSCQRPHYSASMACRLLLDWMLRYRQPRSVVILPLVLNFSMAMSHLFLHPWERKQFLHLWLYISRTMCMMLPLAWIGFSLLLNIDPCSVRVSFFSRLTHPLIFKKKLFLRTVSVFNTPVGILVPFSFLRKAVVLLHAAVKLSHVN